MQNNYEDLRNVKPRYLVILSSKKKKKKIGAIKADLTHSCENTKMRLKDS